VSVRHRYQTAGEVLRALDLEPYLDSLAQNMSKPVRASRADGLTNGTPSGDLSDSLFPSSPSARMAAAIRARQSKSGMDSSGLPLSGGNRRVATKKPVSMTSIENSKGGGTNTGNTGGTPSGTPKLSVDELLSAYAKGKRDFTSRDLSSLSLAKVTLSGANFHQSKLHKVNLQGANLFNSDFGRASLSQALLKNANLARAYLSHADLQGADLRGADLSYAYLSNANLRGANLCGADLTGAKLADDQLAMAKTNWATVHPSGKRGFW